MKSFFASIILFLSSLIGIQPAAITQAPVAQTSEVATTTASDSATQKNGLTIQTELPYTLTNGQLKLTVTGGVPPYAYAVSSGGLYASKTNKDEIYYKASSQTGTTTITVTDAKQNTASSTVMVITTLSATSTKTTLLTKGKGKITISGGLPPYIITTDNGATTTPDGAFTAPEMAGTMTVTVVDASGQIKAVTFSINEPKVVTIAPPVVTPAPIAPTPIVTPTTTPTTTPVVTETPVATTTTVVDNRINGSCGAAQDAYTLDAPVNGLCATGDASALLGLGPWNWYCFGSNKGVTAFCNTSPDSGPPLINGVCGYADGTTGSTTPSADNGTTTLCLAGTPSTVSGTGPWSWSCVGFKGTTASCSASFAP